MNTTTTLEIYEVMPSAEPRLLTDAEIDHFRLADWTILRCDFDSDAGVKRYYVRRLRVREPDETDDSKL